MLGLDCAATEFFKDGAYVYGSEQGRSRSEQAKYLADLVSRYPIVTIEDGVRGRRLDGWKELTELIGTKELVSDDHSSPTSRGSPVASRMAAPIRSDQGQPDRHADGDAVGGEMAYRPATPR